MTLSAAAHEAPRKRPYWRVSFALDDGLLTVYRFTDLDEDVQDSAANTYTSVPSMEIKLPEATGTLDQKPATIEVPVSAHAFFSRLSGGEAMPPVEVSIWEVVEIYADDPVITPETSEVYHFKGRLTRTVQNAGGRSDSVRFEVVTIKGRLSAQQGISATPTCALIFRAAPCGAEAAAAAEEQLVTIDSIDGTLVNILALGFTPGVPGDIFQRGVMLNEADGIAIGIRVWKLATPTEFFLVRPPPADWDGVQVRILPACNRSLAACQDWGQEENFLGAGIAIPNWHRVHEIPGGATS